MARHIEVTLKKSTSGFGVVSIVFGCAAGLGCWVPVIGILSIPAALIGFLLGFMGLLASLIRKKTYASLPLAGLTVSVISFLITMGVTASTVNTIDTIVKEIESSTTYTQAASTVKDPDINYINKIDMYELDAQYYKTYDSDKTPGVKFKIKNKGDRTIEKLKIMVYFYDEDNNVIFEEDFYPLSSYDDKPLKPGYIWQIEQDKFYPVNSCPSEWKEGSITAEITEIKLEPVQGPDTD